MDVWVVSSWDVYSVADIRAGLCVHMFSFLSGEHVQVKLLGPIGSICFVHSACLSSPPDNGITSVSLLAPALLFNLINSGPQNKHLIYLMISGYW